MINYIKLIKVFHNKKSYYIYETRQKGAVRYFYKVAEDNGIVIRTYAKLEYAVDFVLNYCE